MPSLLVKLLHFSVFFPFQPPPPALSKYDNTFILKECKRKIFFESLSVLFFCRQNNPPTIIFATGFVDTSPAKEIQSADLPGIGQQFGRKSPIAGYGADAGCCIDDQCGRMLSEWVSSYYNPSVVCSLSPKDRCSFGPVRQ